MSRNQSGLLNTYQKDIRNEIENDLDRYIYDVVPDDEDMDNIFTTVAIVYTRLYWNLLNNRKILAIIISSASINSNYRTPKSKFCLKSRKL